MKNQLLLISNLRQKKRYSFVALRRLIMNLVAVKNADISRKKKSISVKLRSMKRKKEMKIEMKMSKRKRKNRMKRSSKNLHKCKKKRSIVQKNTITTDLQLEKFIGTSTR